MKVAVIGAGAIGRRVAEAFPPETVVVVGTQSPVDGATLVARYSEALPADVTIITASAGARAAAIAAVESGSHVVSPLDDPADVSTLMGLDARANAHGVTIALGTAMAPGLSCVLATRLAENFDRVDEVHVASLGTGGPACARRHHAALTGMSIDWEEGTWRRRPGGSGRELVWFPEPVGGADCYRAALADPLLLQPAFPECRRITARMHATRQDRFTSWLPMLRSPHPEGLVGAVRVELRGWVGSVATTRVLGAARPPAVLAAATCVTAARWACSGRLLRSGAGGLASLVGQPGDFLRETGIPIATFEGAEV